MKKLLLLFILLFGCQSMDSGMNHIGCQEGEIVDGECILAEENNLGLFDQELDVDSEINEYGFLAQPKIEGDYPGVIMIHEWWGLNDNIKEMAKILAKEGYVVLAVDLYGGEVAAESSRARVLATEVRSNPEKAITTMKDATAYLKTKTNKVASLGWCFGGQQSLQLSLNEELDATVIYYGHLIDDTEQLQSISTPVLGIFGEEDTSISVQSVRSFESALNELSIENQIHVYPNVGHAFANPSGSNYAPNETIDAWEKTLSFLEKNLN